MDLCATSGSRCRTAFDGWLRIGHRRLDLAQDFDDAIRGKSADLGVSLMPAALQMASEIAESAGAAIMKGRLESQPALFG